MELLFSVSKLQTNPSYGSEQNQLFSHVPRPHIKVTFIPIPFETHSY